MGNFSKSSILVKVVKCCQWISLFVSTINNVFRNSLYEGSDDIYPVHNYVVSPFNATIKTLSRARIPWGPGYALEDGSVVQFEVNKVLVGTPCVIKESTNFEYLNPSVEINTGQLPSASSTEKSKYSRPRTPI